MSRRPSHRQELLDVKWLPPVVTGDGTIGVRHDCRRPDLLLGAPVNLGDAPTDLSHRNIQTVIKSGVKRRFGISNKLVCAKAQAGVVTSPLDPSPQSSLQDSIFLLQNPILFIMSSAGRGPTRRRAQENKQAQEDPRSNMDLIWAELCSLAAGGGLPRPGPTFCTAWP